MEKTERRNLVNLEKMGFADYNRPYTCEACGGMMIYKGIGEYVCEDCHDLAYDDYGMTRNYLETHPGANTAQISANTGVSQKAIRNMLKEGKLEVAANSRTFIKCEMCGVNIRSGRLCDKCETLYNRTLEEKEREKRKMSGYGTDKEMREQKGEKRFRRHEDEI